MANYYVIHGHAPRSGNSRTYGIWANMMHHCRNPKSREWKSYGGRGIKVCERWQTFANFLADMGEPPAAMTIQRRDDGGDFEPLNCEWGAYRWKKHGQSGTPTYKAWVGMIERCYGRWEQRNYVARGIAVCDRWRFGEGGKTGFECFLADMGEKQKGLSLDRFPNNDGNYESKNCRWATVPQQGWNRRTTKLTFEKAVAIAAARLRGERRKDVAAAYGISPTVVTNITADAIWRGALEQARIQIERSQSNG